MPRLAFVISFECDENIGPDGVIELARELRVMLNARLPSLAIIASIERSHVANVAWNTKDRVVCALCEWNHGASSMEAAEHFLSQHLLSTHNEAACGRINDETGERVKNVGQSNYVSVKVDFIERETDRAFLVLHQGQKIWIPKSQVANADDYEAGLRDLTLSVTEWIAGEKNMEIEE